MSRNLSVVLYRRLCGVSYNLFHSVASRFASFSVLKNWCVFIADGDTDNSVDPLCRGDTNLTVIVRSGLRVCVYVYVCARDPYRAEVAWREEQQRIFFSEMEGNIRRKIQQGKFFADSTGGTPPQNASATFEEKVGIVTIGLMRTKRHTYA